MDNFQGYLKKQLIDYVMAERSKGVPLEEIEKVLLDAGHHKNLIDEVFSELEKEASSHKETKHAEPVEGDLVGMMKKAFSGFMAQSSEKEVEETKKEFTRLKTKKIIKEVIEDAEVREERRILESVAFFMYLIFLAIIILFTTGSTGSELLNVIIGFTPSILNTFISMFLLSMADLVPLYVFIPIIISGIFYMVGKFTGLPLFQGMDIEGLSVVNSLFGFAFNVLIVYVRFIRPKSFERQIIKKKPEEKKEEVKEELPAPKEETPPVEEKHVKVEIKFRHAEKKHEIEELRKSVK